MNWLYVDGVLNLDRNMVVSSAFPLMPKYFFHVHNIGCYGPILQELTDNEAAWREASLLAAEMLRDNNGKLQPGQNWWLEVTDDRQKLLYEIRINTEKK
jgi:hypothetical protein